MKKLFLALISCVLMFCGCSKDEEPEVVYSEKQQKVFALFNGTWADTQYSNLSGGEMSELLPDPDKIVFGTHYEKPIEVYKDDYMNGEVFLYDNQGECTYYLMPYKGAEYETTECYYSVNRDADYLRLYRRSDNSLFKRFDMSVKSETEIHLQDPNLTLPYIFVKQ